MANINFLKGTKQKYNELPMKFIDNIYITDDTFDGYMGINELWGDTRFLNRIDDLVNINNNITNGDESTLESAKTYTETYVTTIVGNINSILDEINGEIV